MPKILGGEARGRKKVRMATKWDKDAYEIATENDNESRARVFAERAYDA
jgi:hypothetical protein